MNGKTVEKGEREKGKKSHAKSLLFSTESIQLNRMIEMHCIYSKHHYRKWLSIDNNAFERRRFEKFPLDAERKQS